MKTRALASISRRQLVLLGGMPCLLAAGRAAWAYP